ncbi:hypothetical protein AEM42_14165 [Betaproteobacteria bacterium UKL13-2]|nr:hypothetical protein AEM42_14165 [Betaproteobacteria bacterium UKL13-2]
MPDFDSDLGDLLQRRMYAFSAASLNTSWVARRVEGCCLRAIGKHRSLCVGRSGEQSLACSLAHPLSIAPL